MATKKPQVYVFTNTWKNRHGDDGVTVKVFGSRKSANKYFGDDLKNYLSNIGAINEDTEEIDSEALDSFDTGDISSYELTGACTLKDFQKSAARAGYAEIDVDGSGTSSSWSIAKQTVR